LVNPAGWLGTPADSGPSEGIKDPNWFEKSQAMLVVNIAELSAFKRRMARSKGRKPKAARSPC
jgi:hypothetical protein